MTMEMNITRRQMLAGASAAALAIGVPTAFADVQEWQMEAEVVVLGGGSGLLAAIDAADAGAKVILLEKAPVLGGQTSINEAWTTASGTVVQKEAGIEDTPEAQWERWLINTAPFVPIADLDYCKQYVYESGAAIDRLVELGATFVLQQEPVVQETPRSHLMQPNAHAWVEVLEPAALERGVEIVKSTRATGLVVVDGEVRGVKAVGEDGEEFFVKAAKAVILATGDNSNNYELKRRYFTEELSSLPVSWPYNEGDGFKMAKAIGADTSEDCLMQWGMIKLDQGLNPEVYPLQKSAILVNLEGKRFADETSDPILQAYAQTDSTCFMVFGSELAAMSHKVDAEQNAAGESMYLTLSSGIGIAYLEDMEGLGAVMEAETVEELAEQMGVDAAALAETIDAWNAAVESGVDEEFGRPMIENVGGRYGATVGISAPYYAMRCSSVVMNVLEGPNLLCNLNMEVKDVYGNGIPRLYACGSGLTAGTVNYVISHGEHMVNGLVGARIAAANAAALESWE